MKKINDLDTNSVNDLLLIGKKILNLVYILLIIGIVIGFIFIGKATNVFTIILSLFDILMPLFLGFIIAWLFSPLVDKLHKKGVSKGAGAIIVYIGLIGLMTIFFSLFVPVISKQIAEFIAFLPSVINSVTDNLNGVLDNLGANGLNVDSLRDTLNTNLAAFGNDLASSLPQNAMSFLTSTFSGVFEFVLSLILGLYILIDFDRIKNTMIKFIPTKNQMEAAKLMTNVGVEARKTVNGILLVASMVFVCDTIGFAIIGLEASLLIGLFCGITDLIPYIGPYIGGGVAVIIGFAQGPVVGIGVLIIAFLVQAIEAYVLQPVVMSKATNIHPIIIMVSLLIFGYFFGIVGMIFSTPILSIVKVIYIHFNEKYKIFDRIS